MILQLFAQFDHSAYVYYESDYERDITCRV
jgi:hypothetical protein